MSTNRPELMFKVQRVDWDDASAVALRASMTSEMQLRYADRYAAEVESPADMAVSAETVAYTGVAYPNAAGNFDPPPVGHVALRWLGADLELKRMFVVPSYRGRGVSVALLGAVEDAAARLGVARIVLQTGDRQPDAVHLYTKAGYTRIPIFAPYEALTYSNCFAKLIPADVGPDAGLDELPTSGRT